MTELLYKLLPILSNWKLNEIQTAILVEEQIEQFKKKLPSGTYEYFFGEHSKQESNSEVDYVIMAFREKGGANLFDKRSGDNDLYIANKPPYTEVHLTEMFKPKYDNYEIFSVKRLMDGVEFTIGDETEVSGRIYGFEKRDFGFCAVCGSDGMKCAVPLLLINKKKEKQPLMPNDIKGCSVCGSELILIRGKYPDTEKRKVCPTCAYERLEQISEISNKDYGKTYQNSN